MNTAENIRVEFDCDDKDDIDIKRLDELVRSVCVGFGVLDVEAQVSIVDDARMIHLHRQFLNENTSTDVMSFDLSDDFESGRSFHIVVNLEQARRQAQKRRHGTICELALYITHGLLHQFGYDDNQPAAARAMHKKEDAILQAGGFGVIYHKHPKFQK